MLIECHLGFRCGRKRRMKIFLWWMLHRAVYVFMHVNMENYLPTIIDGPQVPSTNIVDIDQDPI